MAFPDLNSAIAMVKSQAGLALTNTSRDPYILDRLNQSAGTIDGVLEYRPYFVAAMVMWTSKGEQTISRAEGDATFRQTHDRVNLQPVIEGNLRCQQAEDISQETDIPAGYDTQYWLDALCGCADAGEASGLTTTAVLGAIAV